MPWLVEGASKDIDTTYYDGFPSGDIKQKAAMFFLEQGLFTGAEYFKVLNNDQHILACGVEDSRIYIEHRASYKKHKRYQDNVVSHLEVFNKALEAIKEYTLSPDLIELYAKSAPTIMGISPLMIMRYLSVKWRKIRTCIYQYTKALIF